MAYEIFDPLLRYEYYPGGEPGALEQKKGKSGRKNPGRDEVRPGELYKAPADEPDRLADAIE